MEIMRRINIKTTNKEIYRRLSQLHFVDEVVLRGVKKCYIDKIIKNINKNGKILEFEKYGDLIVIKKKSSLNFNIYFR